MSFRALLLGACIVFTSGSGLGQYFSPWNSTIGGGVGFPEGTSGNFANRGANIVVGCGPNMNYRFDLDGEFMGHNLLIEKNVIGSNFAFARITDAVRSDESSKKNEEVTVSGCVSRLNSNFILEVSGKNYSYQLQATKEINLDQFLGKEVEVTGSETTPMSTSSPRASMANPLALNVHSIKTVRDRCSAQ
jgi:hypothetical protein